MSYDLKIQNKCDDIIYWERRSLESDRRTITLSYPVASISSVSLRINGIIQNPSTYRIYKDKDSLTQIPDAYIILEKVSKLYNPLIEVKYVTIRTYCPKCAGLRYIDDIRYSVDKDIIKVEKELLLIQTLEKHIVTKINSNPYHTWIGTELHELVKTKINDRSLITSRVKDSVNKAINDLKKLQAQYQKTNRPVTRGELFGQLLGIEIIADNQDPTTLHTIVRFTSQSGKVLEYEQLLDFTETRQRLS